VDDLFGFLAERIAQQLRASREAVAEQRRLAGIPEPSRPPSRPPSQLAPAPRPPVVRPVPPGAPALRGGPSPQPYVAAAEAERSRTPRPTRVALDEAFPGTFEATLVPRAVPANALLRAFAGGNALLGSLVLSEALAPPLALREGPPHRP